MKKDKKELYELNSMIFYLTRSQMISITLVFSLLGSGIYYYVVEGFRRYTMLDSTIMTTTLILATALGVLMFIIYIMLFIVRCYAVGLAPEGCIIYTTLIISLMLFEPIVAIYLLIPILVSNDDMMVAYLKIGDKLGILSFLFRKDVITDVDRLNK